MNKFTVHQAIALYEAMSGTHFIGVIDDDAIERPVSPECSRLLDSMNVFIVASRLLGETHTLHKTDITKLRDFYQGLADALTEHIDEAKRQYELVEANLKKQKPLEVNVEKFMEL